MISVKYPPFSARGNVLGSRPNLVSCAQLAPLVAPAARAGLAGWPRAKHVERPGRQSRVPVSALGWLAWSLARIRSTTWTCSGVAAWAGCSAASGRRRRWVSSCTPSPSEHVRQLDAVDSRFRPRLAGQAPVLAGAERMVWLDLDDTVIQTYGYAKLAAGRGYT